MEYLFRLPDGRRLALWSERNQIVRLVPGGGQSQSVIRTDFLADLSAVMHEEKIYFVYQNIAGAVMFHAPDAEDVLLFAERLENCRFGGLTLTVWQGKLFLLYTSWNAVRESYSLKLWELPTKGAGDVAEPVSVHSQDNVIRETELVSGTAYEPSFQVLRADKEMMIGMGEKCLRLEMNEAGEIVCRRGSWMSEQEQGQMLRLKNEVEDWRVRLTNAQTQLDSAVSQYNELAELTKKLQQEGKHWRDRYYQETKKRGNRSGAVKAKRISELSE